MSVVEASKGANPLRPLKQPTQAREFTLEQPEKEERGGVFHSFSTGPCHEQHSAASTKVPCQAARCQ